MNTSPSLVAYFCAEFALQNELPTYAGGLGVLAGDVLKTAASENIPMVGVGLLYHGHQAQQTINQQGRQIDQNKNFDLTALGYEPVQIDNHPLTVRVPFPNQEIKLLAYSQQLSEQVTQYWLEVDVDGNPEHIRRLTDAIYSGDETTQLQQSILLGVGGTKLLAALGINPRWYHLNEGRPSFVAWELLTQLRDEQPQATWSEILKQVRNKIVYTNHTLVDAGNLTFAPETIAPYLDVFANLIGIDKHELQSLGQSSLNDRFSITDFALRISKRASGVSRRHTQLAQEKWPQFEWHAVTNGVHFPTWQKAAMANFNQLSDDELWQHHRQYKHQLSLLAQKRTGLSYDPDRLIIGWARRIALYKQLDQLVNDAEKLAAILSQTHQPMQLLVAGKAHPGDETAKDQLQKVIEVFQTTLSGVALFIPDYDLELAQGLVSGTDIWLNFPKPNMEASGTSGMKAISNGVIQATTAGGWAAEEEWSQAGWVLDPQDPAKSLYDLLQNEIGPTFYQRNQQGLPASWIQKMRLSMQMSEKYQAKRMLQQYQQKLYQEA